MAIRKRIGIMMPATNTTVEPDFHRVAPPGVTVHSQHLWLTNHGFGADDIRDAMDGMNDQLEQGARYLAQGAVEVVSMVGTTNSFYRDVAWSNEMENIMSPGRRRPARRRDQPLRRSGAEILRRKEDLRRHSLSRLEQRAPEAVLRVGWLRGAQRGGRALSLQGGSPAHERPGARGHRGLWPPVYAGTRPTCCSAPAPAGGPSRPRPSWSSDWASPWSRR